MLSSYCIRRDDNGLPVVARKRKLGFVGEERTAEQLVEVQKWNAPHSILCSVVESLGFLLDRVAFLENHVLHDSINKARPCSMKANASIKYGLVEDEIARLKAREVLEKQRFEEILGITQLVMKYSLHDISDTLPDAISPCQSRKSWTLIRMFKQSSHTSYTDSLGFCCSNWKLSKRVKGFPDLQQDNKLLRQGLRNHCEGSEPSDWISLIDNVPEALKFIEKWKFDKDPTSQVALVSIAKLNRLKIVCDQSDNLVKMAGAHCYSGANPTGIQFA
jgi:hypothetical protein